MESYFASAERKSREEVEQQLSRAISHPFISTLLKSMGGLLAVLNEDRQILVVNDHLLTLTGAEQASDLLGLRPGEALGCIHSDELPGGCGTSSFCSTCGAAIAIVTSLASGQPVERTCCLTAAENGDLTEYYLQVRGATLKTDEGNFVLLFLQDHTENQRRAELEKTFFHDFNNILLSLTGLAECLDYSDQAALEDQINKLKRLVDRLRSEVEIHRILSQQEDYGYDLDTRDVSVGDAVREMEQLFSSHPVAEGKKLIIADDINDKDINTDKDLLLRVLTNMVTNALEATEPGGKVKFWTIQNEGTIDFCVWNKQSIPEEVSRRVFQRHFSTKQGAGRGFGTYTMKLLGEKYLKGQVLFSTSEKDGTVFRIRLFK